MHTKSYQHRLARNILLTLSTLSLGLFAITPAALALPSQGTYDNSAAASISTADKTMNITGKSANNVLNWQTFSIAKGETVAFDSSNYLNLVHGATKSTIDGLLSGGGTIYLINPNGILFGSNAQVNVGSLVASTRPLESVDQSAFSSGGTPLSNASSASGDIVNQGRLQADSVTLEGNDIVLTNTANITSDGSSPLTDVTIKAAGDIDAGYSTGSEATSVNTTQYTSGNADSSLSASALGYKASDLSGADKTINDCMLVRNVYELQNMQNNLSGNYMVGGDIDAKGFAFSGIGGGNAFSGIFDGGGFTISNLTISSSNGGTSTNNVGLFGYAKKAGIRNVNLANETVTGGQSIGGLIGYSDSNTIKNVSISGTISGSSSKVGGIAGYSKASTTENTSVSGSVSGNSYVGGIVGYQQNGDTISASWNAASVTGAKQTGGIVGESSGSVITNVLNTGEVTGNASSSQYIGGIAGRLANASSITNASNAGAVTTGQKNAGGIVGVMESGTTLSYAVNTGTITGQSNTAGIVGNNAGTISHAVNAPSAVGEGKVSAIIGSGKSDTVSNAYYASTNSNGETLSYAYTGGGSEKTYDELLHTSAYAGWDVDTAGTGSGVWRQYDGASLPLLKVGLTTVDTPVIEKTYNGYNQSVSVSDYTAADSSLDGTKLSVSSDIASGKNAGTYEGGTVYSTSTTGYNLVGTPTLKINKAKLLINVNNAAMTYGNSTVYYTDSSGNTTQSAYSADASSLKGEDTLDSIQDSTHQINVTVNNGALSTDEGRTTNDAGTYDLTITDNGSTLKNYDVVTGKKGTVTVNKAKLKATVNDITTTYGTAFDNAKALTVEGAVNGDSNSDIASSMTITNEGEADGTNGRVTQDVGTYTLTADFGSSKNYTIEYDTNSAKATVTKATLDLDNVKLNDVSTTYGTAFDTSKYTIVGTGEGGTGLVNGDTVSSLGLTYTNTGDGTNGRVTQDVGAYTLSTTVTDLKNYNVTGANNTLTSTATVERAPLTLTADNVTVQSGWASHTGYTSKDDSLLQSDWTSETPYSGTVSGFVNGDEASVLDGHTIAYTTTDGSAPTAVGTHSLTGSVDGSTVNAGKNYYIVQDSGNASTLTITEKAGLSRNETPAYATVQAAIHPDNTAEKTEQTVQIVTNGATTKLSLGTAGAVTIQAADVSNGAITINDAAPAAASSAVSDPVSSDENGSLLKLHYPGAHQKASAE